MHTTCKNDVMDNAEEPVAAGPSDQDAEQTATSTTVDSQEGGTRRRPMFAVLLCAPIVLIALAFGGWSYFSSTQLTDVIAAPGVPEAPKLTAAGPDQVVYRVDPYRSSVAYEVEETLAGNSNTARGETSGIAGDILVDSANPQASTIGEIVVNVEQLKSDQTIRDNRLRHDFLQSTRYPLARLTTTSVTGFPAVIDEGSEYELQVTSDLTVRDITKSYTYTAKVTRSGDSLRVFATIDTKLSDFGIGPISLGPLVSTGNDAKLIVEIDARDVAAEPLGGELATGPESSVTHPTEGPSFAADVQPILEKNCASCHVPGESGSQVWTMATAGDAATAGKGLQLVTSTGYMPPWPASDAGIPLQHPRKLSDEDVKTIADWAAVDAPLDVDPSTKIEPAPDELEAQFAIREDKVLAGNEPYLGSTDLKNDYRCQVLDPQLTSTTFVTGFEFRPDQRENVHHALGFKVDKAIIPQMQELDDKDPGAGWQCFAGMSGPGGMQSADGATPGSQLIMGWVPGQRPHKLPEGSGIKMAAGDVIVVQTHYHFPRTPQPDRSTLAIEISDRTDLDEVVTQTYLGPAEIPCAPDEQGPLCDRDTVIERLTSSYGPTAAGIPNGLMLLCRKTLADFKDLEGNIARSSCDQRVRLDGELIGVHGHEHEIGATFRMTLNPGTPEEKVLLDIPDWDFKWQLVYAPEEKIMMKKGDVLRIECSWDRSLIKSAEPTYITWAEGTEDEMCYSAVTTRVSKAP